MLPNSGLIRFFFLLFPIFSCTSIDKIKIKSYICLLFDNNK